MLFFPIHSAGVWIHWYSVVFVVLPVLGQVMSLDQQCLGLSGSSLTRIWHRRCRRYVGVLGNLCRLQWTRLKFKRFDAFHPVLNGCISKVIFTLPCHVTGLGIYFSIHWVYCVKVWMPSFLISHFSVKQTSWREFLPRDHYHSASLKMISMEKA